MWPEGSTLRDFNKYENKICESIYRGTKSKIGDKMGDQIYNFAKYKNDPNRILLMEHANVSF